MKGRRTRAIEGMGSGSLLGCALLLALSSGAAAQTVAITGGELRTGDGLVLSGATLLIVDGTIAALGNDVTVPPGARRIDASGKIVTPGFMDAYTALGLVEISAASGTVDAGTTDPRMSVSFDVRDGINPAATAIPVTRVDGITRAGIVPQSFGGLFQGLGVIANLGADRVSGMVDRDPAGLYVSMGEAGSAASGGARGAATARIREAFEDARDYAGNREAYRANRRRDYAYSRRDLDALVLVAQREIPMVVRADRASDIILALELAQELGIDLVLAGALEGWMVAAEIAAAGVPVIVTSLTNLPAMESLGATYENAARLEAAGVDVILSSFDTHNARNLRQVLGNAVSYGMSVEGALAAVTSRPARVFGVSDTYGTLRTGMDADVVIWSGDPFELTTWAETVFIKGSEVPPDTRQRALFERYRTPGRIPPG